MIGAQCTVKTLSAIANSFTVNLVVRAADVKLKEGRKLVLMVRETPLHKGHLELMARAADCGAVILPPMPAFYHRPQSIIDIVHQSIGKALDQVGIEHDLFERWTGRRYRPRRAPMPSRAPERDAGPARPDDTSRSLERAFWRYSLQRWARPEFAQACLSLQEAQGQ